MSIEATKWARMADVQKSSSKAVLLNLAMLVRYDAEEWTMFASIEYLSKVTHLNRKTVIEALARLRELGAIQDTGRRAGDNRSSIVYRLCPNAVPLIDLTSAPGTAAGGVRSAPQTDLDFDRPCVDQPCVQGQLEPGRERDANDLTLEADSSSPPDEVEYASPASFQPGPATSAHHSARTEPMATSNTAIGDTWNACASAPTEDPPVQHTAETLAHSRQTVFRRSRQARTVAGAGATRLPTGWDLPAHWRVWTQRERPHWTDEKIDAMATTFYAYMRSRPGDAGMSLDWYESWRLWVFREWEPKESRKPWHASWSGIVAKGKTLGLTQAPNEPEAHFKRRVFQAAGIPPPH